MDLPSLTHDSQPQRSFGSVLLTSFGGWRSPSFCRHCLALALFLAMYALSLVALLLSRYSMAAAEGIPTIRETLLKEARHRLEDWFLNDDWRQKDPPYGRLDWPKESDGIQLQMTSNNYICDDEGKIAPWEGIQLDSKNLPPKPESIPITFGRFDVQDADAIDVFNALSDFKAEEKWDELLMNGPGATYLGDFAKEFVRGAAVSFVARPFPDRQVFQWIAYNSTPNHDDMWVVYSTRRNELLHSLLKQEGWPAVQAHNCLGTYHMQALPQGGCHVVFSTMVNSHPPWPITAKFVFNIAWTKTAEYIEAVRKRAQLLKKRRLAAGGKHELVVPRWLVYDNMQPNQTESGELFVADSKKVIPPFLGPDYIADIVQADLLPDFSGRFAQSPLPMVALLAVVTFSLGMVLWRCQRHGSPGMTVLGGASLEEGIAPPLLE
eukprot:Skav214576  [mRNA]  locus=scaffold57:117472:118776:+ [translate_table: standard]